MVLLGDHLGSAMLGDMSVISERIIRTMVDSDQTGDRDVPVAQGSFGTRSFDEGGNVKIRKVTWLMRYKWAIRNEW